MEYEKRIEEIHNNYVALEGKVNETIKMVKINLKIR